MLSSSEITNFISSLPKDLTIIHNNKEYKVNKMLSSSLSKIISNQISKDPSNSTITFSFDDNENNFPELISFLNGNDIKITPKNDFPLNKLAEMLEIESLKKITLESLNSSLSCSNIIYRILQQYVTEDQATDFFEQNIEEIIASQQNIFELDYNFLNKIAHSENSKFSSESSRYMFILNCCVHFPGQINLFFTEADIDKIPDEVLYQMTKFNKYSLLDGNIPTFLIVRKLKNDIKNIELQIERAKSDYKATLQEIDNVQNENMAILEMKKNTSLKNDEVSTRNSAIADKIQEQKDKINPEKLNQDLSRFRITEKTISQIIDEILMLKQKFEEIQQKGFKNQPEINSIINDLMEESKMLVSNSDIIEDRISELNSISQQLQKMINKLRKC